MTFPHPPQVAFLCYSRAYGPTSPLLVDSHPTMPTLARPLVLSATAAIGRGENENEPRRMKTRGEIKTNTKNETRRLGKGQDARQDGPQGPTRRRYLVWAQRRVTFRSCFAKHMTDDVKGNTLRKKKQGKKKRNCCCAAISQVHLPLLLCPPPPL